MEDQSLVQFANRLGDAIMSEKPLMAVLGTDESAVFAVVNKCVALLVDQPIRIVRIRGSRNSPLTLSRIVQELDAGKRGEPAMDDDELIVRVLARPGNKQGRVLLIIEHAELLPLRTLMFLQVVSTVFGTTTPRLQLLFSAHPKFKKLIEKDELAGIQDRLETIIQVASASIEPVSKLPASYPMNGSGIRRKSVNTSDKNHRKGIFISLCVCILAGLLFMFIKQDASGIVSGSDDAALVPGLVTANPSVAGMTAQSPSKSTDVQPLLSLPPMSQTTTLEPSRLSMPPQPAIQDPDTASTIQPTKRQSWPAGEQLTRLREEFDHFITRTEWGSKRPSENERLRLFNEFLQWNYGVLGSTTELPAQTISSLVSHARVTLKFLKNSVSGKSAAHRFATTLHPSVALVQVRSVTEVPKTFELRYFAQEDEVIAKALMQSLEASDVIWTARIIPDAQPAPIAHTIELWIPFR